MDTLNQFSQLHRGTKEARSYQFWDANRGNTVYLPDGSKVTTDSADRIVEVEYDNGAKVKRYEQYVFVQSADGSFWLGDKQGRWHAFD